MRLPACLLVSALVWNSSKSLVWNSPDRLFGSVGSSPTMTSRVQRELRELTHQKYSVRCWTATPRCGPKGAHGGGQALGQIMRPGEEKGRSGTFTGSAPAGSARLGVAARVSSVIIFV